MLVFVTAVKHPDNSASYEDVWRLLNNTLYSVCSQNDTDFRVVVVCDKKLPLFHNEDLINKYTDFVEVDFPSHGDEVVNRFNDLGNLSPSIEDPTWWKQWSRDAKKKNSKKRTKLSILTRKLFHRASKSEQSFSYMSGPEIKLMVNYALNRGSKQLIGILAAKKYDPEYVLIFDADDYVGNDIATYVNAHPGENGWIMTHGYKLSGNLITPFYCKTSFCGTGNIINYSLLLENIPKNINETSTQDELFRYVDSEFLVILARHGKIRAYYRKKGRDLLNYPSRSAIHLIGHHESNDVRRRGLRKEQTSLRFEEAQKFTAFSPITQDLLRYFNILSITEKGEPAAPLQKSFAEKQKRLVKSSLYKPVLRTQNDDVRVNRAVKYSQKLTHKSLRYQRIGTYIARKPYYPSDIQYNLTISEERKFIWFRVGKVASRTILDVFNQANVQLAAEHPFDILYPVNMYASYFRFAFVRNPWDRLVSCWRDKIIGSDRFLSSDNGQNFEGFVNYVAKFIDLEYGNPHLRLQSRLIDINHIDFLGRFETFEEDLEKVMKILDIEATIKKINATDRKADYRDYYIERTKNKVAELYKKDIQIFNYKF
jgi:Sulfotransferase family